MPEVTRFDHIHVYAKDRATAEAWYRRVFALTRVPELEGWATNNGPLFLSNVSRTVSLALFEAAPQVNRTTIAFRVSGGEFLEWRDHLQAELEAPISMVDHDVSWSIYFTDMDANPFEITSYKYEWLRSRIVNAGGVTK